jgi:hypothetical protein
MGKNFVNIITVVFYEYPAALHNIKEWESSMYSRIKYKQQVEKSFLYILDSNKRDSDYELIYCFPIDIFNFASSGFINSITEYLSGNDTKVDNLLHVPNVYVCPKNRFNKLLLFGKFRITDIDRIKSSVQKIKNYIKFVYKEILKTEDDIFDEDNNLVLSVPKKEADVSNFLGDVTHPIKDECICSNCGRAVSKQMLCGHKCEHLDEEENLLIDKQQGKE